MRMNGIVTTCQVFENNFYRLANFSSQYRSQNSKVLRVCFRLCESLISVFTIKHFVIYTTNSVWSRLGIKLRIPAERTFLKVGFTKHYRAADARQLAW
jgi:hypothetical protein